MTKRRVTLAVLLASVANVSAPAFAQAASTGQPSPTRGQDPGSPSVEADQATQSQGSVATQSSTAAQTPSDDTGGIGDIVVTANRVASTAQRTATSLTVYSGDALKDAGVSNVATLQTIDPSVNFTQRTGNGYVAVRGIASSDNTEIGDPSVPIARDGFFVNRGFAINTSFYDIERVEILKGPQGTLFGRNSTGGLVNITTRRPGKELGGNFSLELGNYDTVNAEAGIDIPLNSDAQLRFSGISRRHDGYRRLLVLDGRGDDDNTVSGRAQLTMQPVDGLNVWLAYQHDDVDAVGDVFLSTRLGTRPTNYDAKAFANYYPSYNIIKGDRYRWEFSYDNLPADLTLTYAGGFDKQSWRHGIDASTTGPIVRQTFFNSENPETWNHEVRIATPTEGRFSVQAGYFHFDEKNSLNSGLQFIDGPFANRYLIRFNYRTKTQSDAVFGQAGFRLTPTIRLTGGARYTWDKKDRVGNANLDLQAATNGNGPPITIVTPGDGSLRQSKPTYHAGIDWTPSSRNLVYAKFDTGYKSGGFNSNGRSAAINYGPENLKAWEIGTKNKFLDNNLLVNVTGFYQDYSGYQASQSNPALSSGAGVFNIGNSTIYGVEGQIIAIVDKLRFDVNTTYLRAKFSDDAGSVSTNDPATGNAVSRPVGGNTLPNAPRLVASAGVEYPIALGDGQLTLRLDGKYSSAFYFDVFNFADTRQGRYATGNVTATYVTGPYTIQGFVRNFTDETVFVNAQRNFTGGSNNYQFQPPRTYGMRLGFSF